MDVRHAKPMLRLCRRLRLPALFLPSLLGLMVAPAFADETPPCRSVAATPELLALADWPLERDGRPTCAFGAVRTDDSLALAEDGDAPGRNAVAIASRPAAPIESGPPAAEEGVASLLGPSRLALDDSALDEVRGGFELPDSGLKFFFGIERAVYINGQLVASTVLNVRDLQVVSGAGGGTAALPAAADAAGLLVVQNGGGNGYQLQAGANAFGTVVQNSLDNQKIQSITTINAAVNTAQALRAMTVQSAIQDGLVNSLRR